jgi:hypothetical protein
MGENKKRKGGRERRISALVSEDVFETLKTIAEEKKVTMTEVLRQAISLEKWFYEAQKEGARIVVERNGREFEVEFL